MSQNKTIETLASVVDFVKTISDEARRDDSLKLIGIFEAQTGFAPKLWGPSIIGFGSYHYKYDSGREGDAPLTGFSPRKDAISLYFAADFEGRETLLGQLGKHKTAKSCVYIKKLADIDTDVLKKIITASAAHVKALYP